MQLNYQLLIISLLFVSIVISFTLNIAQVVSFTGIKDFHITNEDGKTEKVDKLLLNKHYNFSQIGTLGLELKNNTAPYRNWNIAMHVISTISGLYLLCNSFCNKKQF